MWRGRGSMEEEPGVVRHCRWPRGRHHRFSGARYLELHQRFPGAGAQFLWRSEVYDSEPTAPWVRCGLSGTEPSIMARSFSGRSTSDSPRLTMRGTRASVWLFRACRLLGPMNVGVIGLGAGTLTTYGRPDRPLHHLRHQSAGSSHRANGVPVSARLHGAAPDRAGRRAAVARIRTIRGSSTCWRWTHFPATRFQCIC